MELSMVLEGVRIVRGRKFVLVEKKEFIDVRDMYEIN